MDNWYICVFRILLPNTMWNRQGYRIYNRRKSQFNKPSKLFCSVPQTKILLLFFFRPFFLDCSDNQISSCKGWTCPVGLPTLSVSPCLFISWDFLFSKRVRRLKSGKLGGHFLKIPKKSPIPSRQNSTTLCDLQWIFYKTIIRCILYSKLDFNSIWPILKHPKRKPMLSLYSVLNLPLSSNGLWLLLTFAIFDSGFYFRCFSGF